MSDRIAVMSSGKILQVGGPRDIYDRPAERFVAEFIGETNFLTADVASVSGNGAHVVLPGGAMVAARLPEGLTPSGTVTVIIRPEHATITPHPGKAHLRGTLTSIVYVGTDTHFHVALEHGERFCVRRQNTVEQDAGLSEGDAVGILIESGGAQVLKD